MNAVETQILDQQFDFRSDSTKTIVAFDFASTRSVEIVSESILYDFNSIVSAVGGALGLFLGFSFYTCIMSGALLAKKKFF